MDELKKLLSRINIFSALVNFFLSRAMLLEQSLKEKYSTVLRAVSYTHLTLPTSDLV